MKRVSLIAVCLVVATFSFCLFGCGDSGGAASSSAAEASSSSAAAEASSSASESEAAEASESASASETAEASEAAASESAETASEAAEGFDFVPECTDEHGNISLYALTELKGWQVATLLDQQGYAWDEENSQFLRAEDGASFSAMDKSGLYNIDKYNEKNEKGGAISAIGYLNVAGYPDVPSALAGNAQCVVEDSYFDGDIGVAIFHGPSMKEYLVVMSPETESTIGFIIFSQEAIGSGFLDEIMGHQVGGSLNEVWTFFTGEDHYGA